MKRKWELFKSLFLTYSRSSVINWIVFFLLIIGMIFNLYSITTYKIVSVLFMLEILIINANTYKIEDLMAQAYKNEKKEDDNNQTSDSEGKDV